MIQIDELIAPEVNNKNDLKKKNSVQSDGSEIRYAIYSGDVNQDGIVDASDLSLIDNDVFNSVSGYVNTDVTGDNIMDASDLSLADNNVFRGIMLIRPPEL